MPTELSPLEREIRERIELDGPLSIADYMALCLTHPKHGYYTTRHPVGGRSSNSGEGGDFITAPEVSQMFGELIGVWCVEVWQALGRPRPFNLAEIGPGRGTLMKDLLRAASAMPDFLNAAEVHLIEISPTLADQQASTLEDQQKRITWLKDFKGLPEQPTILIGNEILDALPFRQWMKVKGQWLERAVGMRDADLCFTTRSSSIDPNQLPPNHTNMPDGSIFEIAPARESFVAGIAQHLAKTQGAALLIDYGNLQSDFGDTFQAIRNHDKCSPLSMPGHTDLTSHVDFEPLLHAAKSAGCAAPEPITQSEFLLALGLLERAGVLGADQKPEIQKTLQDAVERLAGPNQMGDLFKVMAFGASENPGIRWPGFS